MTSILLEHLSMRYSRQSDPVLDDLSLAVCSGELLALLGPSGSGKSTILKLIAGIEQPDSGDIRFDEASILGVTANRRGAVLMFQKAYLFPFLNVADNIGFGLKVQRTKQAVIRAEVGRMLELVELPGIERKLPHQLSGGEQQRVALARALVTRPRVLMLDEPLSNLDTAVRHTLQESIRRIQREVKLTTLLVTHDLSEAITMSDRTALLLQGRIEACDRPQQLFERPPTRAAAYFMGISTVLDGQIEGNQFSCSLGTLRLAHGAAGARPATVAIRPEHLSLTEHPIPNTLEGIIASISYKGEFTDFEVAIRDHTVRVRVYRTDRAFTPGQVVYVHFPPEHLFEVG